jgi:hypothetical protein
MDQKTLEIINGTLLGDGCIFVDRGKYFRYKITAKDENLLLWISKQLKLENHYICFDKNNDTKALVFSSRPFFKFLRQKWYIQENGKTRKIVPKDLELTPTTLLFWYLGDGSLIRRKKKDSRVPPIVLATCCFSKEDVDFLIKKLAELDLNFYPVRYKSGFNRGEYCGYCLFSTTQDGTPFKFFKLIGFQPPEEIKYCSLGSKGKFHEEKLVIDKWSNRDDWIKILSNFD